MFYKQTEKNIVNEDRVDIKVTHLTLLFIGVDYKYTGVESAYKSTAKFQRSDD